MITNKSGKKDGKKGGATIMLGGAAGAVIGATVGSLAGKALLHAKSHKHMNMGSAMQLDEKANKIKANMEDSIEKVSDMTNKMQEKITKK